MMYIIVDAYEQYEYNFPTSLTSHSIDRRVNDGIRKFVAHDYKLICICKTAPLRIAMHACVQVARTVSQSMH